MTETPAQAEVSGRKTVSFDHFGRTWTVPAKVRLSHMRAMQANPTEVGIVDALLDDEQVAALDEIDPDDSELSAFTSAIERAMGYSKGNSSASPASS